MSRKILLTLLLFSSLGALRAQNLQLHFDPRHTFYGSDVPTASQNYLTATFEMFKPDQWGSTFMFVDFDLNNSKKNIGLVYAEIAREFKIGDFPLMPHLEFNGGLGNGFSIPSSYMAGFGYPFQLGNFFMSTYVAYKLNAFQEVSNDAQWTVTWNATVADGKLSLAGFLDLWSENKDHTGAESGKKLIMLSEPQLWYNFTPNFALGTEVELSYNFVVGPNHFYAIPTLATKWNF
ncbi:MAG: DUF5020 family protein [Proteiniphilum sp.]|jgi:hypothetical protein|nr:DUF5020 family protein [Proteiniphilum sp.]NCB25281.1 DUF5020 family protein [Bacteroidia bacterium]MDD2937776.1 DUF5020 family protein [Proteiniphilum sp.]MDD3075912.1 DUF5020 family protein [Proteiniphilum sp.]MDD3780241.1 DUF5020 family protein [Proteiniphilum sp.]